MDIASTLLTKKAAVIGGSTAATTTAVVVPIAVTQSNKEKEPSSKTDEKKIEHQQNDTVDDKGIKTEGQVESESLKNPPEGGSQEQSERKEKTDGNKEPDKPDLKFSAQLSVTGNFIEDDFNKPSDCTKKMFLGIGTSSIFTKPSTYPDLTDFSETEVFSSPNNPPELGCFIYNGKQNEKYRVEIALRKNNSGWVWTSGIKKDNSALKLWFREYVLTKEETNGWKVSVGQEGTIPNETTGNKPWAAQFPTWLNTEFPVSFIDPITQEDCNRDNCKELKAKIAYWTYTGTSKDPELVQIGENTGRFISLWSGYGRQNSQKAGNREHVYKDGKWNKDGNATGTEKALIKMQDNNAAKKKGKWHDLKKFCLTTQEKTGTPYTTFCGPN